MFSKPFIIIIYVSKIYMSNQSAFLVNVYPVLIIIYDFYKKYTELYYGLLKSSFRTLGIDVFLTLMLSFLFKKYGMLLFLSPVVPIMTNV